MFGPISCLATSTTGPRQYLCSVGYVCSTSTRRQRNAERDRDRDRETERQRDRQRGNKIGRSSKVQVTTPLREVVDVRQQTCLQPRPFICIVRALRRIPVRLDVVDQRIQRRAVEDRRQNQIATLRELPVVGLRDSIRNESMSQSRPPTLCGRLWGALCCARCNLTGDDVVRQTSHPSQPTFSRDDRSCATAGWLYRVVRRMLLAGLCGCPGHSRAP
jgi:hypothetical protein